MRKGPPVLLLSSLSRRRVRGGKEEKSLLVQTKLGGEGRGRASSQQKLSTEEENRAHKGAPPSPRRPKSKSTEELWGHGRGEAFGEQIKGEEEREGGLSTHKLVLTKRTSTDAGEMACHTHSLSFFLFTSGEAGGS